MPDLVGRLARRPQQPGRLGAERLEQLGLVERRGDAQLLLERVDGAEQLRLAVVDRDQLLRHSLQERAHLALGIAAERRREGPLRDLVGRDVRRARDERCRSDSAIYSPPGGSTIRVHIVVNELRAIGETHRERFDRPTVTAPVAGLTTWRRPFTGAPPAACRTSNAWPRVATGFGSIFFPMRLRAVARSASQRLVALARRHDEDLARRPPGR